MKTEITQNIITNPAADCEGAKIKPEDVLAFAMSVTTPHAVKTEETGISLIGDVEFSQLVEIVDTPFGPKTGFRYLKKTHAVKGSAKIAAQVGGLPVNCLLRVKKAAYASVNDLAAYETVDVSVLQSDKLPATLPWNFTRAVVEADDVAVATTQKDGIQGTITFGNVSLMGESVAALGIEVTGVTLDNN